MEKRITVMSTEGIIAQFGDTNPFETDLELLAVNHPEWAYITYAVRTNPMSTAGWTEVATVYRHTVAK